MYTNNDHTFVITAHGECEYLEECMKSLTGQTVKSKIILITSTPNDSIYSLAEKYNIPVLVSTGNGSISSNWNFAFDSADTALVTLAHQDDTYKKDYTEIMLKCINSAKDPIVFFSNYFELRNGKEVSSNILLNVKKFLLLPIKFSQNSIMARRMSLMLGCPICCPAVTYVKPKMPGFHFSSDFRCNLDWDAWERLSKIEGSFVYDKNYLIGHRIHNESTTTQIIGESDRTVEDLMMFKRFWPTPIAKLISKVYSISEYSNSI